MIQYAILPLAILLGILTAKTTKDEKQIYSNPPYFPTMLWILAIATSIFYTTNRQIALTLTFIFIMVFVWNKA